MKIKKGDYVFLKWIDSCGGKGWVDTEDIDITGISTIHTVGIVFEITKVYITIIQSNSINDDQIDNFINIPIVAITDKKILK